MQAWKQYELHFTACENQLFLLQLFICEATKTRSHEFGQY